ncbi:MAG: YjgN family protein [Boseongicola sp.]
MTVLTVGIYRFWMKTRLRRYYWSSIRPGGHPLEYVGDPLEKLLGFFIAVVILAFYIGVVNLILMFISFSLFDGNTVAYLVSFLGVIPIWFYARYRARRYVFARTRWRGIRFGVDPGAWGYAWRALVHWAITILTLGLLWPRMTFWLEKYRWDRTWFGDRQFDQGGRWTVLFFGFLPVWLIAWSPIILVWQTGGDSETALGLVVLSLPLIGAASIWYLVRSFRLLTKSKTAGDVQFRSNARTPRVLGIYVLGYALTLLVTGIAATGVSALLLALAFAGTGSEFSFDEIAKTLTPETWVQIVGITMYFLVFIAWGTFRHVFVTLPIWRHFTETLEVIDDASVHLIRQRDRDAHREAEGFAEALDLGAAI